ncbi:hypothetical protein D3OALGA1CA_1707 [Olavius algarvensis associated proteobacterium Delta 3]|nr:hypothetical protein D3OALGA1CA_1707 [Olavius algarvensis associated proteobacterium Delta 3]CAB5161031.1 hypothetical protein D3OALGB2SA_5430 [Olavius algarvensis associated proteobacterium Delta 3]
MDITVGLFKLVKIIAPLIAAVIIGKWFLTEVKKAKIHGEPWYRPYFTPPGLIILMALMAPVLLWLLTR